MVRPLAVDLAAARRSQREAGDYIRSARAYPEWLGDVEGAKRGAEDALMEEVLILAELNWFPGTEGTHFAGLPLRRDDER